MSKLDLEPIYPTDQNPIVRQIGTKSSLVRRGAGWQNRVPNFLRCTGLRRVRAIVGGLHVAEGTTAPRRGAGLKKNFTYTFYLQLFLKETVESV